MESTAKSTGPGSSRSHSDYTIACICPMGVELAAVEGMLDEIHTALPVGRDQNAYTLGKIGDHLIVVAVMPKTGLSPASRVATQLQNDFPAVRFSLLVGIGGGVPGTSDIRLGDVVVSQPTGTFGGVIQYDLGKRLANGHFQRTGSLNEPPEVLSASVRQLESRHRRESHRLSVFLSEMIKLYPKMAATYSYPAAEEDRLFQSSYCHQQGITCHDCDVQYLVQRLPRSDSEPQIHYGTIGSANVVVKDAVWRDTLKTDNDVDILCVEMEAAGLMNSFPCLVIRGICDYADSHKNKNWQPYAAATAAAYMKELLLNIPTQQKMEASRAVDIPSTIADDAVDTDILASLSFTQMGHRRLNVRPPHPNTCQWILTLPAYQKWRDQPIGLLWVKGKPGSGKSTLMSSLYTSLQDEGQNDTNLWLEFFFNARGTRLHHSFEGMLRSLLNQLFRKAPQCRPAVRKYYQDKCVAFGKRTNAWEWHERELQALLSDSIVTAAQHKQILLFVDALDEAGESAARTIAEYLHSINDQAITASAPVKICISCRHYPIISESWRTEVCVEHHNESDITAYVRNRFDRIFAETGSTVSERELWLPLQSTLIQRAKGVFQWISIVTKIVEDDVRDGLIPEEVWPKIQKLSDEISEIYEHILINVIRPEFRAQSFLLFQWACLAEKPLTVGQMRYAIASIAAIPHSRLQRPTMCHDTSGFVKTDAIMRRRIQPLSGGLLEVQDDYVQVGHQTIRDFLEQRGLTLLAKYYTTDCKTPFAEQSFPMTEFDPNSVKGQCHSRMYWSCLKYMATEMVIIRDSAYSRKIDSPGESLTQTLARSPLITYAVEFVFVHAEKAGQHRTQHLDDQVNLMDRITLSLTSVYRLLNPSHLERASRGTTALHMAASAGFNDLVVFYLKQRQSCDERDQSGQTALHFAARWGHEQVARSLIEAGADVNQRTNKGVTPLSLAAANGHLNVVSLLMERDATFNDVNDRCKSAFLLACESGHEHVAWMFLQSGVDVNAQEGIHGTALNAASASGHDRVVQMLIDAGADVNAQVGGNLYGNALQAASIFGYDRAVQVLIDAGADVNAQSRGGPYGNALQAASEFGYDRVVQMLIDAGADVNAQGGNDGNAINTASGSGHDRVVQMLIDAGADVNAQGGHYGTALQEASRHGHGRVVQMLIDAGANVNAQGGRYGTILQAASQRGFDKVVQILIDAGADVNAQGGDYGNALHAASISGYDRVVQMLIDAGADVNAQGGGYGTALQAALFNDHNKVARLLVAAGAEQFSEGICPSVED